MRCPTDRRTRGGRLWTTMAEVLVASTGVIGQPLDMDCIEGAIPDLVGAFFGEGLSRVAKAIMTTDSFPKMSRFEGTGRGKPLQDYGDCKGRRHDYAQHGHHALLYFERYQDISERLGRRLLASVETTFNRITVDGDTSTNDMVLVMANGMAGMRT